MQIPKDQIVSMIESRLGGDQAQQAAQQLPDQVDHEQHAGLLSQFGIDPQELVGGQGQGGQAPTGGQEQGGGFQDQGAGGSQDQGAGSFQDQSGGGFQDQSGGGFQDQSAGGYQDQGSETQGQDEQSF